MTEIAGRATRNLEIEIRLIIEGDNLDPESVTTAIGLEPTKSWRSGERTSLRSPTMHEHDGWMLVAPAGTVSAELDHHCQAFFDRYGLDGRPFGSLPANARARLYCVLYDPDRRAILRMSARTISRAAAIGLSMDIIHYTE
jgi:hypothetical protein